MGTGNPSLSIKRIRVVVYLTYFDLDHGVVDKGRLSIPEVRELCFSYG